MLSRFVAGQLSKPSGVVGRVFLPRLFNVRNRALNDLTFECLDLQPGDRVLEVGCGGGYLVERVSGVVTEGLVVGVDSSPGMVAFCERRYGHLVKGGSFEVMCAGAEALPYPPGHFTKTCTVNTVFYFADASRAVSELWRVLAGGGLAVICFTCKEHLEDRSFAKHGLSLYEPEDVQRLMESAGFGKIRMVRGSDRWREFICAVGRK